MASQPYLGAIFIFAGNFAPRGFQLCQGQLLPIAQYTALFSILGTTYGGNGQTNFALPDLRGRAPIGQGPGPGLSPVVLGEVAGVQNVSILSSNMPAHNHLITVSGGAGSENNAPNNYLGGANDPVAGTAYPSYNTAPTAGSTLAPACVSATGGSQPISVQNPYLGINYIIAMEGIFPSRN
jgi:microcystin-dependent protein